MLQPIKFNTLLYKLSAGLYNSVNLTSEEIVVRREITKYCGRISSNENAWKNPTGTVRVWNELALVRFMEKGDRHCITCIWVTWPTAISRQSDATLYICNYDYIYMYYCSFFSRLFCL